MLDASLDIALDFIRAHPTWYIFPIARLEKFPPCFKDNLNLASNDPKQIRKWHAQWRGCNWGVALRKSNVLVMDVDLKPGKRGQETFDNLTLEYGELPDTLTVMSPSGGLHYYFTGQHRFGLGKHGFGLDVDSPNYVLIPGCWLCSNSERGYEIVTESPVAEAPAWFGEFLKDKAEKEAAETDPAVDLDRDPNVERMIRYLQEGAPPCIQGKSGEKTLFDVACVLKDNGVSESRAVELLATYYNVPGKCEPLWLVNAGPDSDRLDIKVHNAYQYARENQAGSATAEFAFGDPGDRIEQAEVDAFKVMWAKKLADLEPARAAKIAKLRGVGDAERGEDDTPSGVAPPTVDDSDFLGDDDPPTPPPPGKPPAPPKDTVDDSGFLGDDEPAADEPPEPEKPRNKYTIDRLCEDWVWTVSNERFVRIKDGLMWSRTQFDSRYNHLLSQGASLSAAIFKIPGRIQRFEKAAFRPGRPMIDGAVFNLWRPSPIKPVAGDTNIWNEHLNYLFQNPEDRDHVLNWLAWVYQNQSLKPNHALLIVGKNTGTGKSFIARVMEQLIGTDNTQRPKNSSLKGDFNGWAQRCKLCIIEELMQIGRREVANELRDIITEPTIEVNVKNIPAQLFENFMAMMGISNHPDALPIDETDRRWLVVSTPVARLDPVYYRRLFTILDSPEALAAIAHELKTRDLKGYDATQTAPFTDAKREMIELSRSDVETWLYENMRNAPLSRNIVSIPDITESMPSVYQRTTRLSTVIVPTFLRDKLRGEKLGNVLVTDCRLLNLWALHGRAEMVKQAANIGDLYEAERKAAGGSKTPEEQAADDFGE